MAETLRWREMATGAIRFWEPCRLLFNAALAAVVLWYFGRNWPGSWERVGVNGSLVVFLLAVLANICYSTAYIADLFIQASGFAGWWKSGRWLLFAIGTAFALIVTRFVAMGMFGQSGY